MTERPSPGLRLAPSVLVLSAVSFLTDVAADMVVPFLPLFIATQLHGGAAFVGLIDGVAETTAALMKYFSGAWSDRTTRKKPLVLAGYGIASLVRPLLALATSPLHVLLVRFADRIGKGLRTAPRDAIIARDTPPEHRGFAFGFHRGMDNLGAVFGPLIATGILLVRPNDLRLVFACTALPGLLSVLLLAVGVRDPKPTDNPSKLQEKPSHPQSLSVVLGAPLDPRLRGYLALVAVFTLANASDSFLLLRAHDLGVPTAALPLAWGGLSLLRAVAAPVGGRLADRLGRGRALALGWALYAVAWAGFGLARSPLHVLAALLVYGGYYGLTEGTERALVASFSPPDQLGRAYGLFNLVTGLLALPSSALFGLLYARDQGTLAFVVTAGFALVASVGMARWSRLAVPQAT